MLITLIDKFYYISSKKNGLKDIRGIYCVVHYLFIIKIFFLCTLERSLLFSCLLFMALFVTFMSQDLETNIAIIWSQLGNIKETKDAQKRCGNLPFQNLHIT